MFKKIKNKIDSHFIRLANSTLDNKLSSVNQKTNDISAKLNANDKRFDDIDKRFDSTNNNLIAVNRDLIAVNNDLKTVNSDLSTLKNHLDLVNNNLTNIISDSKKRVDVDVSTYIKAAIVHQKTFTQFKDYCKGKKLVICGAGPSLNKYQPIKDAVHIALNRSILFDKVHFDFLFCQDFVGISMITNEILNYPNCIKLFSMPFPETVKWISNTPIPETFARECHAYRFYINTHISGDYYSSPFTKEIDLEPLAGLSCVGLSVLQFALYMNPTDIYLVGHDVSGTHFTYKNLSNEEKEKDEAFQREHWEIEKERTTEKYKEFLVFKNRHYPEIKIHSINPVGLKGIFDDIYQE